jgi:YD repeat-containing protein
MIRVGLSEESHYRLDSNNSKLWSDIITSIFNDFGILETATYTTLKGVTAIRTLHQDYDYYPPYSATKPFIGLLREKVVCEQPEEEGECESGILEWTHLEYDNNGAPTGKGLLTQEEVCAKDLDDCSLSATTTHQYTSEGNLAETIAPNGLKTSYEYDEDYLAYPEKETIIQSGRQYTIETYYSAKFDLATSQYDANGVLTQSTLNALGEPETITVQYDGKVLAKKTFERGYGNPSTDGNYRKACVWDRLGDSDSERSLCAIVYMDGLGRTYKEESPAPSSQGVMKIISHIDYTNGFPDKQARVSLPEFTIVDPEIDTGTYYTSFEYDALGRPIQITTPSENGDQVTVMEYDYGSRVSLASNAVETQITTQPNGVTNYKQVSDTGKALQIVQAWGSLDQTTLTYQYDIMDRLEAVTGPVGTTQITYNERGQQETLMAPDIGTTLYKYYEDYGEPGFLALKSVESPNPNQGEGCKEPATSGREFPSPYRVTEPSPCKSHVKTEFVYDFSDRIHSQTFDDGSTVVFDYDTTSLHTEEPLTFTQGRIVGVQYTKGDLTTHTLFNYDPLGNKVYEEKRTAQDDVELVSFTHRFAYDDQGRLSQYTYPNGRMVAYSYSDEGNLAQVSEYGSGAVIYAQYYSYNPSRKP